MQSKLKFNLYKPEIYCVDYRLGRVIAEVEKLDEPMNGQMYMLSTYYQEDNSGIIDSIVGSSIEDDKPETIQKEVEQMIRSGYVDDAINGIVEQHEEYEEYFWEKIEKEKTIGKTNNN